jgi:hypothetical protein
VTTEARMRIPQEKMFAVSMKNEKGAKMKNEKRTSLWSGRTSG